MEAFGQGLKKIIASYQPELLEEPTRKPGANVKRLWSGTWRAMPRRTSE